MKYLTILGDGMADLPLPERNGQTPLELADKPFMDRLASRGRQGLVCNVPPGMSPGSDTANMSAMGLDPERFYSGRSPLEAVSMGIDLRAGDIAFRSNLLCLSDEAELADCTMLDYSAGEISSAEAAELIAALNEALDWGPRRLYAGKSYRHCMVWPEGPTSCLLTPPHDIFGRVVADYLPQGEGSDVLLKVMQDSRRVLAEHPINRARIAAGKNPANCLWPWGLGTRPEFPKLSELYGIEGSVISAVDLVQGIGLACGMEVVQVEGATGTLHSNFAGKARAAIAAFERGRDYVYIHLEAPDECGHQGDTEGKIKAIELIDREILAPLWAYLEDKKQTEGEAYRIFLLPDHPTPLALRTHTAEPVPYVLYDSEKDAQGAGSGMRYSEANARRCAEKDALTGRNAPAAVGHRLFAYYIDGQSNPFLPAP